MTEKEFEDLLSRYVEAFGEPLPTFFIQKTNREWAEIMNRCLEAGAPYVFDWVEGRKY